MYSRGCFLNGLVALSFNDVVISMALMILIEKSFLTCLLGVSSKNTCRKIASGSRQAFSKNTESGRPVSRNVTIRLTHLRPHVHVTVTIVTESSLVMFSCVGYAARQIYDLISFLRI